MVGWIDELAEKNKEKYQAQRQEDERFNTEQKLKVGLGIQFWTHFCTAVTGLMAQFNKDFGAGVMSSSTRGQYACEFTARFTEKGPQKSSDATYSTAKGFVIEWTEGRPVPNRSNVHTLSLTLIEGRKIVARGPEDKDYEPSDIARSIIEYLAG